MKNLPTEVLSLIFNRLHQKHKVECMLVCHNWNKLIKGQCLLDTVVISAANELREQNGLRLWSLFQQIQSNCLSSYYTQRLVFENFCCSESGIQELSMTFPNLRSLYMQSMEITITNGEGTTSSFAHWLGQLNTIYDHSGDVYIPYLMKHSYQFNQLVFLSVSGTATGYTNWFKHLKYAPSLITLKLHLLIIELREFEVLHENAPLLTTLELTTVEPMMTGQYSLQLRNKPIIETLCIKHCIGTFFMQDMMAKYITQNYTNLVDFTFEVYFTGSESMGQYKYSLQSLTQVVGARTTSFRTNIKFKPDSTFNELDDKLINLNTFKCLFYPFDTHPDIPLFSHRYQFHSLHNLHTLEICHIEPSMFVMKKDIVNLKHLVLDFNLDYDVWEDLIYKTTIELDTLLYQCPDQLESLTIINANTTTTDNHDIVLNHFKSLTVVRGEVDTNVSEFLSKRCSSIRRLTLKYCTILFDSIDLPHHDIDFLNIVQYHSESTNICIHQGDHVQRYPGSLPCSSLQFTNENDTILYRGIRAATMDTVKDKVNFHFKCRSLHTLWINGSIAV